LTWGLDDQAKRAATGFSTLSLQTATVVLLSNEHDGNKNTDSLHAENWR
jgi:hypothetical protein